MNDLKFLHIASINERLDEHNISAVEKIQRYCFVDWIQKIKISNNAVALSVSVGDGVWDYLVFLNNKKITRILATDIVENPVIKKDIKLLNSVGKWEFKKVIAEKPLPFTSESFDLIFHQDVVEHTEKPFLFLSQQYRVLKKNGILIFGTPNLFRPANLLKLLLGKLNFPIKMGSSVELGNCTHMQEFNEQQIRLMLKEVGFKKIETKYCFFGIHPLNIIFKKYPKNNIGKQMCHFLMFKCSK